MSTEKRRRRERLSALAVQNVCAAMEAGMSQRKACALYGVARSTFNDKKSFKTAIGCTVGPSPAFTRAEEAKIMQYIDEMAQWGRPLRISQLCDTLQKMVTTENVATPFTNGRPGRSWFRSFLRRHPEARQKMTGFKSEPPDVEDSVEVSPTPSVSSTPSTPDSSTQLDRALFPPKKAGQIKLLKEEAKRQMSIEGADVPPPSPSPVSGVPESAGGSGPVKPGQVKPRQVKLLKEDANRKVTREGVDVLPPSPSPLSLVSSVPESAVRSEAPGQVKLELLREDAKQRRLQDEPASPPALLSLTTAPLDSPGSATQSGSLEELQMSLMRDEARRKRLRDEEDHRIRRRVEKEEADIRMEILKTELLIKKEILKQEIKKTSAIA